MTCPSDIHKAFSEILYWTILEIRNCSADGDYCFVLADHAHNIPRLIDQFDRKCFYHYWECERECFFRALGRQGKRPSPTLVQEWENLKALYDTMRATDHVAPAVVMELDTGMCEVALDQVHIEQILSPTRGVSRFRVLDREGKQRILSRNTDGTYGCEVTSSEPHEIRTQLLLFGGSKEGFDPSDLQEAHCVRDMFAAYLKQEMKSIRT